jgi:hypothetical protein
VTARNGEAPARTADALAQTTRSAHNVIRDEQRNRCFALISGVVDLIHDQGASRRHGQLTGRELIALVVLAEVARLIDRSLS